MVVEYPRGTSVENVQIPQQQHNQLNNDQFKQYTSYIMILVNRAYVTRLSKQARPSNISQFAGTAVRFTVQTLVNISVFVFFSLIFSSNLMQQPAYYAGNLSVFMCKLNIYMSRCTQYWSTEKRGISKNDSYSSRILRKTRCIEKIFICLGFSLLSCVTACCVVERFDLTTIKAAYYYVIIIIKWIRVKKNNLNDFNLSSQHSAEMQRAQHVGVTWRPGGHWLPIIQLITRCCWVSLH